MLKERVPRLIRMLVSDWAQKIFFAQSEAIINRTAFLSFLYEGVYLQTRLFSIPVLLVQESFPREEFFGKMGPTKSKISSNLAC